MKFTTPSKSIKYSLVNPRDFETTLKLSFPPYKIISNAFLGILEIGSFMSKLYLLEMLFNCLKTQLSL